MALMSLRLWELDRLGIASIGIIGSAGIIDLPVCSVRNIQSYGKRLRRGSTVSGHCGFGLGATPNGIANMKSITEKYIYSKVAFFVIPIVGALFIDFFNVSIITWFISYFK